MTEEVKRRKGYHKRVIGRILAYLLIVAVASLGFWQVDHERDRDARQQEEFNYARCESSRDYRTVQRSIINAIYGLAIGITTPPVGEPKIERTEQEQLLFDDYVRQVEEFRSKTLKMLKPSDICEKYDIPELEELNGGNASGD